MPDHRSGPGRTLLVALAVLALAGCSADPATPAVPDPSGAVSSAGPVSAGPSAAVSSATPTPSPTPPRTRSETYANDLTVADDGQVDFTPLRWYQGKRAEDRCTKLGISSPTAWCHDYYYEKSGSATRASLTDDTAFTLLDDEAELKQATAAQFRRAVTDEAWPNFRLWLVGNEIQRVEQVYTP